MNDLESRDLAQRLHAVSSELNAARQANQHQRMLAETRQRELDALRSSWSWRLTAPLRWVTRPFSGRAVATRANRVPLMLRPLVAAMRRVLLDPQRTYRHSVRLKRYPRLHKWLVALAKRAGIHPAGPAPVHHATRVSHTGSVRPADVPWPTEADVLDERWQSEPPHGVELTAAARRMYRDLLAARADRRLG